MVSRKRNKGKERKAKKTLTLANKTMKEAEAFLQEWEKIVCSFWRALSCGVICDAIFDPTHTGTMFVIQDFARGRIGGIITRCGHGTPTRPYNNNHLVERFIDSYFYNWGGMGKNVITNLRDTFEKYPEVWNVESHCNMVINKLVCVGTNLLLSFDDYVRNSDEKYNSMRGDIAYTACAIVVLENYDGNGWLFRYKAKRSSVSCGG